MAHHYGFESCVLCRGRWCLFTPQRLEGCRRLTHLGVLHHCFDQGGVRSDRGSANLLPTPPFVYTWLSTLLGFVQVRTTPVLGGRNVFHICPMFLESDRPDGPDGPPQSGVAHGLSLIPVSGVCVVVDEVKTGGNGVNSGTPRSADGMTFEKHTKDRSNTLSQCRCIGWNCANCGT